VSHLISAIGRFRALFSPSEEGGSVAAAPPVPAREVFRRFWPYARPYQRWLVVSLVFVALLPAIEAAEIWLFQRVIDDVLVPRDIGLLWNIAVLYLALNLASGLISYLSEYLSTWVGERFLLDIRAAMFTHVLRLDPDTLHQRKLGDILTRFTGDVAAIEAFVLWGGVEVASAGLRILFFGGALFLLDPLLAMLSLLVVPPSLLLGGTLSRLIRRAARERRRRSGSLSSITEESLSNLAVVQAFGQTRAQRARYRSENEAVVRAGLAGTRSEALLSPLVHFAELTTALLVVALGTWALAQGRLTLGGLLAFLTYLTQLYRPFSDLTSLGARYFAASAAAERVIELLDEEPSVIEEPDARRIANVEGAISLDSVTFRYEDEHRDALRDVSLDVTSGQRVAIVGPSGAGKSTLAKLLVRFVDPDAGSVRLDGSDLRSLTLGSVRANIAVLFQEAMLFDGSIRDNIAFGRPEATDAEIEAAARGAGAHGFVMTQRDGYQTRVGQKGRNLSGGQRQRIAIARTFLADAPVLVLDEPTAGLDTEAARDMLEALERLMEGRTTILISHDLSAARRADLVVVVADGRIVERGSHEDLLASDTGYARLWRMRSSAYGGREWLRADDVPLVEVP
jgi:ABC-type multidrug transport system fused ATPase/permease subunit